MEFEYTFAQWDHKIFYTYTYLDRTDKNIGYYFLNTQRFLARLDEVQEELLYYPRCRRRCPRWRRR